MTANIGSNLRKDKKRKETDETHVEAVSIKPISRGESVPDIGSARVRVANSRLRSPIAADRFVKRAIAQVSVIKVSSETTPVLNALKVDNRRQRNELSARAGDAVSATVHGSNARRQHHTFDPTPHADPHDATRSEQFRHPAQRARAVGMADEANRLTGLHGDRQAAEV